MAQCHVLGQLLAQHFHVATEGATFESYSRGSASAWENLEFHDDDSTDAPEPSNARASN